MQLLRNQTMVSNIWSVSILCTLFKTLMADGFIWIPQLSLTVLSRLAWIQNDFTRLLGFSTSHCCFSDINDVFLPFAYSPTRRGQVRKIINFAENFERTSILKPLHSPSTRQHILDEKKKNQNIIGASYKNKTTTTTNIIRASYCSC